MEIKASPTTPPTTPPAIAAAWLEFFVGVPVDEGIPVDAEVAVAEVAVAEVATVESGAPELWAASAADGSQTSAVITLRYAQLGMDIAGGMLWGY